MITSREGQASPHPPACWWVSIPLLQDPAGPEHHHSRCLRLWTSVTPRTVILDGGPPGVGRGGELSLWARPMTAVRVRRLVCDGTLPLSRGWSAWGSSSHMRRCPWCQALCLVHKQLILLIQEVSECVCHCFPHRILELSVLVHFRPLLRPAPPLAPLLSFPATGIQPTLQPQPRCKSCPGCSNTAPTFTPKYASQHLSFCL